jgi:hypothetical protein
MTDIQVFYELKKKVLSEYRKHHPYFNGNWKNFSSKDILNLIDLISEKQKENVSEKWIYTHLKPEFNEKLPRKDMLDIFSKFAGYSGWDEFLHLQNNPSKAEIQTFQKKYLRNWILPVFILLLISMLIFWLNQKTKEKEIIIKNSYTGKVIPKNEIKVYEIEKNEKKEVPFEISGIELKKDSTKIVVESPFYQQKTINISQESPNREILMKPNDNAMMLRAFLYAEIKDWQKRKLQLENILSENAEILLMLKNNLGTENFDKQDFIKQIIIPTNRIKTWKIVELTSDENNKINFIRILEE